MVVLWLEPEAVVCVCEREKELDCVMQSFAPVWTTLGKQGIARAQENERISREEHDDMKVNKILRL
jgi:hypothetical protein